MNWKRILVPHDFSASANHALAVARDEAKAHGSAIVMLHVIELPYQFRPDTVIVSDASGAPVNVRDYAISEADAHLADLAARLAKDSATATTAIRLGNPVDEITKFVDENDVDLVIMGTHGRSGLAHMLIGSVTERVVRSSKVPVLTIRHHG
jgi:nucleotide-binding universal stress UspA family protein